MIVVRVELHSAITGKVTELARMMIHNIGGTEQRGDYEGLVYRGRDSDTLDRRAIQRRQSISGYPRLSKHVWNLVARMLTTMGYA